MTGWRYWKSSASASGPKTVEQVIRPEDLVGGITAAAAVGGILGAKLFTCSSIPTSSLRS